MIKGKVHTLAYSSKRDLKGPKLDVYTNNFDCLVRVICSREIEEAKKRVKLNSRGTFHTYIPSKEYVRALNKFHGH